ncbi:MULTISPECIES: sigma factor-like helix-turn-helix DNA-binding protein [unclassified Amycolatopsis]|uniref:RNA polymerase sigma factor n=1 Tax=unclassified Amycolatopsis TaxID=2618356 RepID=UPI0028744AE4|nr:MULTISPECIES: sigma factor-like helix-turn-helix DNA-binding protein [unclassified Amycolatopsis]MDS0140608.1 hypothetical protein [Amycolatopsis sp. 505]MDS0149258.1 hypothetical protein [Amycolatopsis sp. CM201R]
MSAAMFSVANREDPGVPPREPPKAPPVDHDAGTRAPDQVAELLGFSHVALREWCESHGIGQDAGAASGSHSGADVRRLQGMQHLVASDMAAPEAVAAACREPAGLHPGEVAATAGQRAVDVASGPGTVDQQEQELGVDAGVHLQRQERLAHEGRLVDTLRAEGFTGPAFEEFRYHLVSSTLPIVRAWIRRGQIFGMSAQLGRAVPHPTRPISPDDQAEIAMETVAQGLRLFTRFALHDGHWQPEQGATLRTYFVGSCIRSFPNVYRRFEFERKDADRTTLMAPEDLSALVSEAPGLVERSPEPAAVERLAASAELAKMSHRTRQVVVLHALGYTQEEIAEVLQVSPGAVRGRLTRQFARVRRNYGR